MSPSTLNVFQSVRTGDSLSPLFTTHITHVNSNTHHGNDGLGKEGVIDWRSLVSSGYEFPGKVQ